MACPGIEHVNAAKRVIGYLNHTRTHGIRFCKNRCEENKDAPHIMDLPTVYCDWHNEEAEPLTHHDQDDIGYEDQAFTYVDADFARDQDTRRSLLDSVLCCMVE